MSQKKAPGEMIGGEQTREESFDIWRDTKRS